MRGANALNYSWAIRNWFGEYSKSTRVLSSRARVRATHLYIRVKSVYIITRLVKLANLIKLIQVLVRAIWYLSNIFNIYTIIQFTRIDLQYLDLSFQYEKNKNKNTQSSFELSFEYQVSKPNSTSRYYETRLSTLFEFTPTPDVVWGFCARIIKSNDHIGTTTRCCFEHMMFILLKVGFEPCLEVLKTDGLCMTRWISFVDLSMLCKKEYICPYI